MRASIQPGSPRTPSARCASSATQATSQSPCYLYFYHNTAEDFLLRIASGSILGVLVPHRRPKRLAPSKTVMMLVSGFLGSRMSLKFTHQQSAALQSPSRQTTTCMAKKKGEICLLSTVCAKRLDTAQLLRELWPLQWWLHQVFGVS